MNGENTSPSPLGASIKETAHFARNLFWESGRRMASWIKYSRNCVPRTSQLTKRNTTFSLSNNNDQCKKHINVCVTLSNLQILMDWPKVEVCASHLGQVLHFHTQKQASVEKRGVLAASLSQMATKAYQKSLHKAISQAIKVKGREWPVRTTQQPFRTGYPFCHIKK